MRKKVIIAICLVCLFGFGFAYISTFGFFPRGKALKRVEALQTLIGQNVRIGDPPDRVIRFLDSQLLEHSYPMKTDMHISGHDYRNQNLITAIKRHTAGSLLWDEAIQLVFVFNEKRELTKFDVIPVYTSF